MLRDRSARFGYARADAAAMAWAFRISAVNSARKRPSANAGLAWPDQIQDNVERPVNLASWPHSLEVCRRLCGAVVMLANTAKKFHKMWFFSHPVATGTAYFSFPEIKTSVTKSAAMAGSIQFERSVQSGNKRLLRLCVLELWGAHDEWSWIRPIAGCRENGRRTRAGGGLFGPPVDFQPATKSRQRQPAGLAAYSISRGLVRRLLITPHAASFGLSSNQHKALIILMEATTS
jgi:hypothetical protein